MPSPEPHAAPHNSHGSTPAAWTAVVIILVAFAIGTWAVIDLNWTLFWVSVGLVAVGGAVGKVMQMLGFGASPEHHVPDTEGPRRDPSVVAAERSAHLLQGEPVQRDDEDRARAGRGAPSDGEHTDPFGQYEQGTGTAARERSGRE
jgi:hypothetical protein